MSAIPEHTGIIGFLIKTGHFMDRVERAVKGPAPEIPSPFKEQLRHDIEHMSDWINDLKLESPKVQQKPPVQPTKIERIVPLIMVTPPSIEININPSLAYGPIPTPAPYTEQNFDHLFNQAWLKEDLKEPQPVPGPTSRFTYFSLALENIKEELILFIITVILESYTYLKRTIETPQPNKKHQQTPIIINDFPEVTLNNPNPLAFVAPAAYTEWNSKIGFSAAPKHRDSSILSGLIFLILGYLRSANFESFRVAQPIFEFHSV